MPLIIEDSSIVENANSFATVDECRVFADARGLVLPVNDEDVEKALVKAADFLFSLEADFQGARTDAAQDLPFPRDGVFLHGSLDISGTIPKVLKQAQCRLAYDTTQADLLATGAGRITKSESVGPLEVEYETEGSNGTANPQVILTAALTILSPLFSEGSTAMGGNINICVSR